MFGWRSSSPNTPEDTPELTDLTSLRNQELAVVFKHSQTCPVSWAAQSQVKKFIANHPEVPVYTVLVRQQREFSRQIADATRIRHESPQVIVLRRGVPIANASHQDVTADFLTRVTAPSAVV